MLVVFVRSRMRYLWLSNVMFFLLMKIVMIVVVLQMVVTLATKFL